MIYRDPPSAAVDGYEFDLFISYARKGNAGEWVQNHLVNVLDRCLVDHLDWEPRIFLDVAQEPGTYWRNNVRRVLGRSRLLIAVWSPPYFRSDYCMAEWQTMLRRQRMVGLGTEADPRGLVYPIRYSDGDSFPAEAANVQFEENFKEWRFPYPQFRESADYLPFHRAVNAMAERLAARLPGVPDWCADWPVEFPEPAPAPAAAMPRL